MIQTNSIYSKRWLAGQLLAAICGAVICGLLFGFLGGMSRQPAIGTAVGALVGAFLGCGLLNGIVGSFTLWIIGFAVLGAIVGPGCDFDAPGSALIGATLGAYFWLLKLCGLFILVGALAGLNLGVTIDSAGPLGTLGMLFGGLLGLALGRNLIATKSKPRPQPDARSQ
jgi:hypothetical protein